MPRRATLHDQLARDDTHIVAVEAGTVGFVDKSLLTFTPPGGWEEADDPWSRAMNDPDHHFDGVANVPVHPQLSDVNMVVCWSGWGDGGYSVIASYDDSGQVNGLHIDLLVLGEEAIDEGTEAIRLPPHEAADTVASDPAQVASTR